MKLAESHFASVAAASPGEELENGNRNAGNGGNGTAGMEKPVPKKKPIKTTLAMPSTEMEEKSEMEKSEVSQVGGFWCEFLYWSFLLKDFVVILSIKERYSKNPRIPQGDSSVQNHGTFQIISLSHKKS